MHRNDHVLSWSSFPLSSLLLSCRSPISQFSGICCMVNSIVRGDGPIRNAQFVDNLFLVCEQLFNLA
ncbi:hypothetical protein KSS87_000522 [Heliosperma pusillum]|nr:hypothetical protein KSS87_000522 [Heliosperma pusillum]